MRDGQTLVPRGDIVIKAKDRAIIFAEAATVKKVEKFFSGPLRILLSDAP